MDPVIGFGEKPDKNDGGNHTSQDGRGIDKPDGEIRLGGEKEGDSCLQLGHGDHGGEGDGGEEFESHERTVKTVMSLKTVRIVTDFLRDIGRFGKAGCQNRWVLLCSGLSLCFL